MAFLKTSVHGFVNVDHVLSVSSYATGGNYGVHLQLTDDSVVAVDSVGTFATQADADAKAAAILDEFGVVDPS